MSKQWGHGFFSSLESDGGPFTAVREGAKDAVIYAMCQISQMIGSDTFEEVRKGASDAVSNWLDTNKEEIIEAIAKRTKEIESPPITAHPLEVSEEIEVILSQRTNECRGCMWHPDVCKHCCCSLM